MTVSDCFSVNVASCNTHSTDVKSADVIIAMAHSTLFTTSVKNIDITLAEVYHGYMTLDTLPKIPAHFASLLLHAVWGDIWKAEHHENCCTFTLISFAGSSDFSWYRPILCTA